MSLLISAVAALNAGPAATAETPDIPAELQGVDIVEHLNAKLPLDLEFTDEKGRTVHLRDYFTGDVPVLLTLNYYNCPMLCNLELTGLVNGLKELEWSPGSPATGGKFRILTISIKPTETAELANVKRDAYLFHYDRPGIADGWHFHVGREENIRALADTVGFLYRLQPDGEYAHAAGIIACTPDGRVSRYLYGLDYKPRDLRLALLEAGEGKVGSAFDRFILWCHVYDPDSNSYVKSAMRIMRLGAGLTLLTLCVGLFVLWRFDFLQSRQQRTAAAVSGVAAGAAGGSHA